MRRRSMSLLTIAVFGYALLYVPILSVVAYSFNDSRLVTLVGRILAALVSQPARQ